MIHASSRFTKLKVGKW